MLYDELAHQVKAMVVAEQKSSSLHLVQDRALEVGQRSSRSRLIQDFAQMVAEAVPKLRSTSSHFVQNRARVLRLRAARKVVAGVVQ